MAAKWYQMLKPMEQQAIATIINQTMAITESYNNLFPGFELYVTGSSLNLLERNYNDIDLMVILPHDELVKGKSEVLQTLWEYFKNKDLSSLREASNLPKIKIFHFDELVNSIIDSVEFSMEILNSNHDALLHRLGSNNEVTRLLIDPETELEAQKVRTEGLITEEKAVIPSEPDGTQGYQFGLLVEGFLKAVAEPLAKPSATGQSTVQVQWHKSFPEGYGKVAGENNCYIYSSPQCLPVHLFLTTGLDQKKAMEKKDSFMLEYYTPQERLQPIKLY